jgi:arsenate reductase
MSDLVIFHNRHCSKSRGTLAILEESGSDFEVVEYLSDPPDRSTLERIVAAVPDEPIALVRTADPKFKSLGVDKASLTDAASVVDLLADHPEVMERPVVLRGRRGVIGRPPERVRDLL